MNTTSPAALAIAGITVFMATVISIWQIICHLRYYKEPVYQRFISRIIFMVPLYGILSFLSLLLDENHIYFDTIRDLYEAWILYNFLSLCLAYVGGPGAVVVQTQQSGKTVEPSCVWCTCCLPRMPVDNLFLRRCKQGVLQFVLIKPIIAVFTIALYLTGGYVEGDWGPGSGYLWIQLIYNICYTIALYALVLFYQGTEELLEPFKPLLKFVLVKSVIFLTFWQGLLLSLLATWGYIDSADDAKNLQNFLMCLEMLGAAFLLLFAFPHAEYMKGAEGPMPLYPGNVRHAISIRDVVSDTVHQFAPQYHDYILYSDDATQKPVRKTVRTFVKMGEETTRYQDGSNLLANMELPHVTSVGPEDTAHSTRLPVVIAEEAASRAEVESTEETEHNMSTEETTVRHDSESTAGDPKFWAEINLKDER